MKTNLFRLGGIALCALVNTALSQTQLISDEFNGDLNPSTWQITSPLADSRMSTADGKAVFFQRGTLATRQDMPAVVEIRGRFGFFGGSYDMLDIALRFDGTTVSPYHQFNAPVGVGFHLRGGDDGDKRGQQNIGLTVGSRGVTANFMFVMNTYYDFRIIDDGRLITVYLNDLTTPILAAISTERTGYKVGFQNRGFVPWFPLRDNQVRIDSVSIIAPAGAPQPPIISSQSSTHTTVEGESTTFTVNATTSLPVTYQWFKDGAAITGATAASLELRSLRASDSGAYSVRVTSSAGTVASGASLLTVRAVPEVGRLINISTLGSGEFVTGFVVGGATSRNVLVRAVGPTLRVLGVADAATETSLTLNSGATVIATNSGWSAAPNANQIAAVGGPFALPVGSADSAILINVRSGAYTTRVTSNGTVLLEVYEVP